MDSRSEVLFIGGRSGVGKSSVAHELHARLSAHGAGHALIDGDYLGMAYPPPDARGLAERNLTLVWANYREHGYRRLIYVNTASVRFTTRLASAMGEDPKITAVLLTASDDSAHSRLTGREIGDELDLHIQRSDAAAVQLEAQAPSWVHRVPTDDRTVAAIVADVLALTGWIRPT